MLLVRALLQSRFEAGHDIHEDKDIGFAVKFPHRKVAERPVVAAFDLGFEPEAEPGGEGILFTPCQPTDIEIDRSE